jgi:hypothetical protein
MICLTRRAISTIVASGSTVPAATKMFRVVDSSGGDQPAASGNAFLNDTSFLSGAPGDVDNRRSARGGPHPLISGSVGSDSGPVLRNKSVRCRINELPTRV